jgi:hypothetical protein
VAVLAWLMGGSDRLTVTRWAGLLAGLAGVALLAGRSAGGGAGWAITEVLLVAVCYAIGPLIASRKLSGLPPVGMTAACLAFAAVVYAPLAALTWTSALPSAKVLAAVAGLAVICAAVAFLLFFRLIAEVGPARASVITYINPGVAVAIGVSVLGDRLTPAMLGSLRADPRRLRTGHALQPAQQAQSRPGAGGRRTAARDCRAGCGCVIGMKSTNGRVHSRPRRTFRACLLAIMAIAVAVAVYGRTPSTTHRRGRIQG